MSNFIVYALPRSRTAWLSMFLTYSQWNCCHEMLGLYLKTLPQTIAFFKLPNVGTVETAGAEGRWLIRHYAPGIREAVIRRSLDDVMRAMMATSTNAFTYDELTLRKRLEYGDRMLDRVAARPGVLALAYADLDTEEGCKAIFEHCLQLPFDRDWWEQWRDENVQIDIGEMLQRYHANLDEITAYKQSCKSELRRLARANLLKAD